MTEILCLSKSHSYAKGNLSHQPTNAVLVKAGEHYLLHLGTFQGALETCLVLSFMRNDLDMCIVAVCPNRDQATPTVRVKLHPPPSPKFLC